MKAVTWHGKRDVRVDTVPDPRIEEPTDAIIEITSTNICGSDLHLYEVLGAFMKPGTSSATSRWESCARWAQRWATWPSVTGWSFPSNLLWQLLYVRSTIVHPVRDHAGTRPGHGCRAIRLLRALR